MHLRRLYKFGLNINLQIHINTTTEIYIPENEENNNRNYVLTILTDYEPTSYIFFYIHRPR